MTGEKPAQKIGGSEKPPIADLNRPSLRAKRGNPSRRAKKEWIASFAALLAMTSVEPYY
ncbi:hypothetical protein [Bradyrhizobium sp. AZCC 2289]|uniref:hypothetical protein n=1 Tax=Bradyrhizobium sp. AZCC 2289 TaxID=3117026 RepID=UPI002FF23DDD